MKHLRIYESGNVHFNAKSLAKKLSKKFFELNEFERIIVEENEDTYGGTSFIFYICFDEVHKETVEAMEKFNEYIGRIAKNEWVFKAKYFDNNEYYIYDFIDMTTKEIDKLLGQLELEEDAKKYNL